MVEFRKSFASALSKLGFIDKSTTETTTRPSVAQPYMSTDTGAKLPIFPFPLTMIYELADNIDALRIPIETLNREMFKNGFEVVEKWKYKCNNCSKEFQYAPTMDNPDEQPFEANGDNARAHPRKTKASNIPTNSLVCDTCGSNDLVRPVPEHRKTLENLMNEPVNSNQQTLEDVARQLERDFEIADNAYLLLLKNYHINDTTGKIDQEKTVIKEMLRIEPPQVAMIADSDGRIGYDDKRNKIFVCPRFEHRDTRLVEPKCDRCGAEALKAIIEVNSVYSIGIPQPKRVIYGEGEIIWKAGKYKPNLLYGFSPIYSVWSKAMSLSHMDEYIRKYFDKMRPPRGLLVISSRNYETFRKSWDVLEQKAQEDPYMIHPLLVENDKGGKNPAQWLDFTGSLKELEFIEVRKELRMIIGAVYGVLPFYYGETPAGWSQEGLQVTITNRAVKFGQDILKKAFFSKISKMLNIDDWELQLKTGEDTDKLRDLQQDGIEIQNMMMLQQMGFDITRTHTGEFKVSKETALTAEMMFGIGAINGNMNGAGKGKPATQENTQQFDGEPHNPRPSDIGGTAQGSPTSGSSMSKKSAYPKGITPTNFEIVKNTFQTAVDYDWKKTKTVEELRKATGMTVRDARDLVDTEFEGVKRWED
jgi:DNA-directed RNA polymerase subunit RPC12/RpoP